MKKLNRISITAKELDALHFAVRAISCLSDENEDREGAKPFDTALTGLRRIIAKATKGI